MKGVLKVLREVHRNERGAVSLETVLIVGAVALPILLVLKNYLWPKVQTLFESKLGEMNTPLPGETTGGS